MVGEREGVVLYSKCIYRMVSARARLYRGKDLLALEGLWIRLICHRLGFGTLLIDNNLSNVQYQTYSDWLYPHTLIAIQKVDGELRQSTNRKDTNTTSG